MTDALIRRKLNQLVTIANELDAEAKRRYGPDGNLFYEADGGFHLMDGDTGGDYVGGVAARQSHICFSSDGYCAMGGGAW